MKKFEDLMRVKNEIENINNFLKNSVVVGHNLNFDLSFLNVNLEKNKFQARKIWKKLSFSWIKYGKSYKYCSCF